MRQQADRGRLARLAGILRRHFCVFELEDVEFDLEAGDKVVAALCELREHRPVEMAGRKRHRPPVGKINIAQQPAGRRRPWQHAKTCGVRHHQNIGGAFHFPHPKTAARGEHRKYGPMRGVLGKHRRGDGASALQRGQRFAGDQCLAPQDSVLVGEREPDDLEFLLFDDSAQARRRFALLVGPKPVTKQSHSFPARQSWIASLRSQ